MILMEDEKLTYKIRNYTWATNWTGILQVVDMLEYEMSNRHNKFKVKLLNIQ